MKKIILFFICYSSIAFGQKLKAEKISVFPIHADTFVGYDGLGFYYFIKDNVLFKQKNDVHFEYKNISLGKISHVDLQNPLKIVLLYEDFNTIITLDDQLNETQKINFSETDTNITVAATGIAAQNQLWFYNTLNQKIGLYDYLKKEEKVISTPISDLIKKYDTDFNFFYWIDNKNNMFSCSIYGKISFLDKVPNTIALEIIDQEHYMYLNDKGLFLVDLKKGKQNEIEISEKSFQKFSYKDQILSIFTSQEIINYKLTLP